jgi:trimeric autotransporter adhesin
MSQARRALVVLVSVIAVAVGFMPAAFARTGAAVAGPRAASTVALGTPLRAAESAGSGYWLTASDGTIFAGGATAHGSTQGAVLNHKIVGIAATPSRNGYWLVASDGGIFSFGDAAFHGSTGNMFLNQPIVGMASTPSGNGYWLVASDGGIFAFGDAQFYGSTGAMTLNQPIVGMSATLSGNGYWFVAADGGIFAFGDAAYHGSTGAMTLNQPIVGMSATPSSNGYWFVAADGGIFAFGDAGYHGSTGATRLNQPIVGMAATATGDGYWFVAADGGVFAYGDAGFFGADGAAVQPIVGMAPAAPAIPPPPPATHLTFTTQPSDSTGGLAFAMQPAVTLQDASGATVPTDTSGVHLALTTPSSATLTCAANTTSAVAGVATFAGCNIDAPGTYTLTATDGALTSDVSDSTTITIGPAARVGFTTQPSGATSSVAFGVQPAVKIQDLGGNTIVGNTSSVTLTITTPAGAILSCTNASPLPAIAGVATFAGCKIDLSGSYTLHAADGALLPARSHSLSITAAGATKLAFTTSPSASTGGAVFTTQPVVKVQDTAGNTVTSDASGVTLTITTPAGALLTCTNASPLPAVAGVATFAGCKIDLPGTYTLHAADAALSPATSASVTITVGAAAKLAFTTSPSASTGGVAFTTQPIVKIQDLGGNTIVGNTSSVTLTITNPAGAALTCTNASPLPAVAGVATFTGCAIDLAGTYTLRAGDGALAFATSSSVAITVGGAAKLGFTASPSASTGGVAFTTQPVVKIQDLGGNTIVGNTSSVTLTITTPAGALLTCTNASPLPAVAGVATFTGCAIDLVGTYTLHAADGGLTPATSGSVAITVGGAARVGFTTSPSASTGGTAFTTQPIVKIQDLGGNTIVGNASSVTLTITNPSGALLACTNASPLPAVAGVATFTGCKIDLIGTYTLHAADGALSPGTSGSVAITVGGAAKLGFLTSPSASTGGTAFTTQPVVSVQDLGGNTVTTDSSGVTLTITTPAGAVLTCTNASPLPASTGAATFTGCKIDLIGTYTLHATDGGLTAATSASVAITVGAAAKVAFTTSPNDAAINAAFTQQPVVKVQDLGGNTVTTDTGSVTLTLTIPGGATITCTNVMPLPTASGVATFTGCAINVAGTYTMHAAELALTPGTSGVFVIS